jgi:hypothetical protein
MVVFRQPAGIDGGMTHDRGQEFDLPVLRELAHYGQRVSSPSKERGYSTKPRK